MLARLKKVHRFIAFTFFHTALLLVVILLALRAWWPAEKGEPIYSKHFDLGTYTRTSPEDAQEIGQEFDRMGEQSSYSFKPWTLFGEREYASRLLNVQPDGLRRTVGVPMDADCGGREPLRVWVLGGSTVFGWGMTDGQTIPSHLQARLAAEFPERCVQVTNHGHSYYFSSVELVDFTRLLRSQERPHCAVFLDGFNDSIYLPGGRDVPYFSDVAYRAWERERERALGAVGDQPWVTFNRSLPLFRLLDRDSPRKEAFQLEGRYAVSADDPVGNAVEIFRTNHRAMQSLGKEFGIEVLHLLQPTRLREVTHLGNRDGVLAFQDQLAGGAVEGLVSISDCLQGVAGAYVDGVHYSDEACHVIADVIAKLISERLGADGPSSSRPGSASTGGAETAQ